MNSIHASPTEHLTESQLNKLSQLLMASHTANTRDLWSIYHIDPTELIQGVVCHACSALPLEWTKQGWLCPRCSHISKIAHVETVSDHLILCGSITNREAQTLLQLKKDHTVKRLLAAMKLPSKGSNKGRVYFLAENRPNLSNFRLPHTSNR